MTQYRYRQRHGRSGDEDRLISRALQAPIEQWDDVRVPMSGFQAGGVKDPGWVKVFDDGASSTGVYLHGFDATSEEELFFDMQLPHGYMQYTTLEPHIHWTPGSSTNTGTVRWGLEYTICSVNGTFPDTTIIYAEDAGDGTAGKHQIAGFDSIPGTDIRISAMLLGRIFRDAGHANDTFTADALLCELDFHIRLDTWGSDLEFHKER